MDGRGTKRSLRVHKKRRGLLGGGVQDLLHVGSPGCVVLKNLRTHKTVNFGGVQRFELGHQLLAKVFPVRGRKLLEKFPASVGIGRKASCPQFLLHTGHQPLPEGFPPAAGWNFPDEGSGSCRCVPITMEGSLFDFLPQNGMAGRLYKIGAERLRTAVLVEQKGLQKGSQNGFLHTRCFPQDLPGPLF